MKTLATTLALIIATTGVVFLGLLTWNELNEETDVTWTNYQACIETVTIEAWHTPGIVEDNQFRPDQLRSLTEDPGYLPRLQLGYQGDIIEHCAELRPPLTTDAE